MKVKLLRSSTSEDSQLQVLTTFLVNDCIAIDSGSLGLALAPQGMPAVLRPVLYLNPFSHMIWCYQDVCYFGRFEHWVSWIVYPLETSLAFLVGYALFRRLRPFLGSAL